MKLAEIKELAARSVGDVCELVVMLELDIEDILDRHADALLDNAYKFGVDDDQS